MRMICERLRTAYVQRKGGNNQSIFHRFHGRPQLGLGVEDLKRVEVLAEVADFQALPAGEQPGVALQLPRRKPLVDVHHQEVADEILGRFRTGGVFGSSVASQVFFL